MVLCHHRDCPDRGGAARGRGAAPRPRRDCVRAHVGAQCPSRVERAAEHQRPRAIGAGGAFSRGGAVAQRRSRGQRGPDAHVIALTGRGSNPPEPTLDAPGKDAAIELRLVLPVRAVRTGGYTIAVRAWTGGETIWSRGGLRATSIEGRATVSALITGDVFAPGAYEVVLTTTSADGKAADVAAYEVATRSSLRD